MAPQDAVGFRALAAMIGALAGGYVWNGIDKAFQFRHAESDPTTDAVSTAAFVLSFIAGGYGGYRLGAFMSPVASP